MRVLIIFLKGLAYIGPAIPTLVFLSFNSPYIYTQTTALRGIALLGLAPLVTLWVWSRAFRPRITLHVVLLSAYPVVSLLVNVWSGRPDAMYGTWMRFGSAFDWLAVYIYTLILVTVIQSRKEWLHLIRWVVLVSLYVSVLGIAQYARVPWTFVSGTRVFSSLGSPAFLGSYLLLASGLSLVAFFLDRRSLRPWYAALFYVHMFVISLTNTRAPLVGLGVAVGVLVLWSSRRIVERIARYLKLRIGTIAVLCAGIGLSIILPLLFHSTSSRNYGSGLSDVTSYNRLLVWKIALAGAGEHPLLGWGDNSFPFVFQRYYDPRLFAGAENTSFFDRAHNELLDRFVGTGLFGVVAYLALFVSLYYPLKRYRADNPVAVVIGSFAAGYFFFLLFFFHSVSDTVLFGLMLAFSYASGHIRERAVVTRGSKLIGSYLIACSAVLFLRYIVNDAGANLSLRTAQSKSSAYERAVYAREAWDRTERGHTTILEVLPTLLGRPYEFTDRIRAIEILLPLVESSVRENPHDVRRLVLLTKLYRETSQLDRDRSITAFQLATVAVQMSPRDPQIFEQRGLIALDIAAHDTSLSNSWLSVALRDFGTAYSLAPSFPETRILFLMGAGLVRGSNDRLLSYLDREYATFSHSDWYLMLQALSYSGDAEDLKIAERALMAVPENSVSYRTDLIEFARTLQWK